VRRSTGAASSPKVKIGDSIVMISGAALFINGVGTGFAVPPLAYVLSRMSAQHVGAAAGVLTTGIQVGNAIGVAIIGIIFYGSLSHDGSSAYSHAFGLSLTYLCVPKTLYRMIESAKLER
jgi:MFS family permease